MDSGTDARARVQCWEATWEGPVEGFAVNFINRNAWRVFPYLDFDDLYQEAVICFMYCKRHYAAVVEPKHFMYLYNRRLSCEFIDLANRKRRHYEKRVTPDSPDADMVGDTATCNDHGMRPELLDVVLNDAPNRCSVADDEDTPPLSAETMMVLGDLPPIYRHAFHRLLAAAQQSGGNLPKMKRKEGRRESTNAWLCRLAGIDPKSIHAVGFVDVVRAILTGQNHAALA